MDKTLKKHMFLMTKGLNWNNIPRDRQLQYALQYVLKNCKQVGKIQDMQRLSHQLPPKTAEELLANAIQTYCLA